MLEQRMEMLSTPTSPEPRDSLEVPVINEQPLPNIDNGLSNKVKHVVFRILKKNVSSVGGIALPYRESHN